MVDPERRRGGGADNAEVLVPASRREFYQASVLTMVTSQRESNRTLEVIAKSIQDAQKRDTASSRKPRMR